MLPKRRLRIAGQETLRPVSLADDLKKPSVITREEYSPEAEFAELKETVVAGQRTAAFLRLCREEEYRAFRDLLAESLHNITVWWSIIYQSPHVPDILYVSHNRFRRSRGNTRSVIPIEKRHVVRYAGRYDDSKPYVDLSM